MKLLFCMLGLALLLAGCDAGTGEGKKSQKPAVSGSQVRQEVKDTADYVTGAKQVQVKKGAVKRVNDLNQKHNEDLEKALED